MTRRKFVLNIAFVFTTTLAGMSHAQQARVPSQQAGYARAVEAASAKRIGFRLADWQTIHGHDQQATNRDIETLKKIGCEVNVNDHGNHLDVQYRCPEWKTVEVPTDQLAGQWSNWLSAKGLETVIVNPTPETTAATVQFRMPVARTLHLHEGTETTQIMGTMKMIGVHVTSNRHGDHMDAKFECPEWKTIQLPTDGHAHAWQSWLDNAGFETKHTH